MNVTFPARIIELFGHFRQLNSILNDNWRDGASKDFFSNFIDPVNSGWKTFHRQTEEISQLIKRVDSNVDTNSFQLRKFMDNLGGELIASDLCSHSHCVVHDDYSDKHFLIPPSELSYSGHEDAQREYALMLDPYLDDEVHVESKGLLSI